MSIIKASQLNKNERYYKLTNMDEIHGCMHYVNGLNIDMMEFKPTGECSDGGLYFFSSIQLLRHHKYITDYAWIREVTFDGIETTDVYIEKGKYKTHQFILGQRNAVIPCDVYKYVKHDILIDAIQKDKNENNEIFRSIPCCMKTYELCILAVLNCGRTIRHVPNNMMNYKLCMIAVAQDGFAYVYIPDKFRTAEISQTAVAKKGKALQFIPDNLKTYNLCMVAIINDARALPYVPNDMKDYRLCMMAVSKNKYMMRHVPSNLYEICMMAISD